MKKGNARLRFLLSICYLLIITSSFAIAKASLFSHASCTIIYSLNGYADEYFNDEIDQLKTRLKKQKIHLIDLNNWRKTPPHAEISGRERNQLREHFELPKYSNQAVIVDAKGQLVSRYTGSVTLVNALLDCRS